MAAFAPLDIREQNENMCSTQQGKRHMFGRRDTTDPTKILRLKAAEWRQGEALRITPRRRWDTDPGAKSMVLRRRDWGELALTPMRWGLVPEWAQGEDRDRPLVSVRGETVAGEIDWRRMLNTRRCLVPTDQFFEWKRVGDVKAKEYAFKRKDRRPMMIAALWNRSFTRESGNVDTFAYISCPANRLVGLIHDRMPVILEDAAVSSWLNPDATLEALLTLLRPSKWDDLELQAVGTPAAKPKPYQPSLFASRAA
jgi:putative SOS response-associated peptidase YedK